MSDEEFVKDYTEREVEEYLKFLDDANANRRIESEWSPASEGMRERYVESLTKAYQECNFTYEPKSNLSVLDSMKSTILSMVETNSVVIIQGPTGCGKTTQIPQLILDANIKKRLYCNIIVTTPRRIAAMSIAKRVSREGGWPLGSLVGYRVGMKREISADTRLTYCTTEILLRQLIHQKHMLNFTHVILDEIHERDQDLDFLLLVVKKLLQTNSSLVKVILMSATIDVKRFAEYFSTRVMNELVPAPVVKIPERRCFEVYTYYLDEIKNLGVVPGVSPSEPKVTRTMIEFCAKIIVALDKIDTMDGNEEREEEEEEEEEKGENRDSNLPSQRYAVLIFLPGIYEIEEMHTFLSSEHYEDKLWDLVTLHSLISSDEQQRVFYKPSPNHRRIILSTNIAESSITVPDVKYVIDFCLVKVLAIDPASNYQSLQLCWASKTNCVQRAGRAGRVMDGRVYRLVPKLFYQNILDNEGTPEMLRAPLANVVLRAKVLDLDDPRTLLSLSLDPPSLQNLSNTVLSLKQVGALINDGDAASFQHFDGKLTDLGRVMAFLPLDIYISKLIMLGHVFGILRDAIILAASMALKDTFAQTLCRPTISSYVVRKTWARDTDSDCIASLNVYKAWQNEKANRRLTSHQAEKLWCRRNGVQLRALRELDAFVDEITDRLVRLGVKETVGVNKVIWEGWERDFVLQVILAGAFYPNYFVKRPTDVRVQKDNVVRYLDGSDPMRTVFLRGWPTKQPGYLYARKLQEIFSKHQGIAKNQIMISFDGSQRVYVQFHESGGDRVASDSDQSICKISDFVYKSIKMRQSEIPIEVGSLSATEAHERCKGQDFTRFERILFFSKARSRRRRRNANDSSRTKLPGLDVNFIPLAIQNIVNPGYFWATLDDEDTRGVIRTLETALNARPLREFTSRPEISTLVAAPVENQDSLTYLRAIIQDCTAGIADVFFIDRGYSSRVRVNDLKAIDDDYVSRLPSLAFRCALASIRPSRQVGNPQGRWSRVAQDRFERDVDRSKGEIFGEIYSVVDSTVNLELILVNDKRQRLNVNEYLVEKGYATSREESYLSRYNHDLRVDANVVRAMSPEERSFYEQQQYESDCMSEYPDPPKEEDCVYKIKLQGPYSPLEIELVQLTEAGRCKRASVETNSVNSVLLDEDFNRSTRLLVARSVSRTVGIDRLLLRNTTLLPNVPGLAALLALIFAPNAELRRSPLGTYYTGALCGLGPIDDITDKGLFPDHDMQIPFDVEILMDDLRQINKLRYWMNVGMRQNNDAGDRDDDEHIIKCQNHIQRTLIELRDRRRRLQDPMEINDFDKWNRYDSSMYLYPARGTGKDDIYPLHKALELEERNDYLEEIFKNAIDLQRLASEDARNAGDIENFCELCKIKTFGLLGLRGHLYSEQHIKNEERLQISHLVRHYY